MLSNMRVVSSCQSGVSQGIEALKTAAKPSWPLERPRFINKIYYRTFKPLFDPKVLWIFLIVKFMVKDIVLHEETSKHSY